MMDLAGAEDSDDGFSELDTATEQHLSETAQRAVRTRRGTIAEFPDRYVDLAGFVQSNTAAPSTPAAVVAASVQDDLEQDERIDRATCVIGQPGVDRRVPFTITVEPTRGDDVVVQGTT
jgi:hypothetical protein